MARPASETRSVKPMFATVEGLCFGCAVEEKGERSDGGEVEKGEMSRENLGCPMRNLAR
jgi:hypothetical protein